MKLLMVNISELFQSLNPDKSSLGLAVFTMKNLFVAQIYQDYRRDY